MTGRANKMVSLSSWGFNPAKSRVLCQFTGIKFHELLSENDLIMGVKDGGPLCHPKSLLLQLYYVRSLHLIYSCTWNRRGFGEGIDGAHKNSAVAVQNVGPARAHVQVPQVQVDVTAAQSSAAGAHLRAAFTGLLLHTFHLALDPKLGCRQVQICHLQFLHFTSSLSRVSSVCWRF